MWVTLCRCDLEVGPLRKFFTFCSFWYLWNWAFIFCYHFFDHELPASPPGTKNKQHTLRFKNNISCPEPHQAWSSYTTVFGTPSNTNPPIFITNSLVLGTSSSILFNVAAVHNEIWMYSCKSQKCYFNYLQYWLSLELLYI